MQREMLLRLFFAHVDKQDCPWLGMAASVNFAEFKDKVSSAPDRRPAILEPLMGRSLVVVMLSVGVV